MRWKLNKRCNPARAGILAIIWTVVEEEFEVKRIVNISQV
jgi:hypothetical protein